MDWEFCNTPQDYDETYPQGDIATYDGNAITCANALPQTPKFGNGGGLQPMWMGYIFPYTKSTQIYYCPSGPSSSEGSSWSSSSSNNGMNSLDLRNTYGYAFNGQILRESLWLSGNTIDNSCQVQTSDGAAATKLSAVNNPAGVVMLADRGESDRASLTSSGPYSVWFTGNDAGWSGNSSADALYGHSPATRHFDGANDLFTDGHVKFLTQAQWVSQKPGILNNSVG